MKHTLTLFIAFFFLQNSFAQCPGCIIDVPAGLPDDTIYLGLLPNSQVGVYYEEDLSFRLPMTTDPVNANDPDIPAGLTIDEITISSLTNIPPGLSWEVNQTTFDPSEETDGCIRFCGTPFVADTFAVGVNIDAVVFGISQSASFDLLMIVEPAISSTDGFTMENNVGCGSTEVSFSNNIPSNGNDGITYTWDFGNGTTTTSENPGTIVYNQPGVYEVTYEAVIDTVGYLLTSVTVIETDCDDFPTPPDFSTAPDLRIRVTHPDGSILFDQDPIDNTNPPVTASGSWLLDDGDYLLEVIDEDSGINGADDDCGTYLFNKISGPIIDIGDHAVELTILHPVTTVNSVDTVIIYEMPEDPIITTASESICEGESVELTSSYAEGNTWFLDGELIQGAVDASIIVDEAGLYTVFYTSPDGCVAESVGQLIEIIELPDLPAFINDDNLLTLFDESGLPDQYSLQWYQDGELLEGETGFTFCITVFGSYSLEVTDLETACINTFTQDVPFNPNGNCITNIHDPYFKNFSFALTPNPTNGEMVLKMDAPDNGNIQVAVTSLDGKKTLFHTLSFTQGDNRFEINLTDRPTGIYFIELWTEGHVWTEKVVKL